MLSSPVPIYLGCAGLIVGSLGLGAQHMLGGNPVSATNTAEQPLFAQSVEEASLPATGWPSQNVGIAYYEPMVELLTTPARSTQPPPATSAQPQSPPVVARDVSPPPQTAEQPRQEPRAAPREIVRDLSQPQTRQSRRTRNQHNRDDARANEQASTSTGQVDPRATQTQNRQDRSRGQDRQRNATDRRYRDDSDVVDTRTRSDRRPREGERVVVREDIREPEQRIVRGPEQREGGFSPFRLFGIFDR